MEYKDGHGYSIDNYNSARTDEAKIKAIKKHINWVKRKNDEVVLRLEDEVKQLEMRINVKSKFK